MTQVSSNQILNAHYTTDTKVNRPIKTVANAPSNLPNNNMPYYDREATKKIQAINESIYDDCKAEKKRGFSNAVKFVSATALAILAALGIKNFFFKKS